MATNTTNSFTNHTGNNTAGPFSISFDYLAESEVVVTVGGVTKTQTTHYTFPSATTISFTSGNHPANGAAIKFQRNTSVSSKKVDFQDGSVLTEADLDSNSNQLLYSFQEFLDEGQITEADLLDEDNMASNSATKAATQQSIKAYVDASSGVTNLSYTAGTRELASSSGSNVNLPEATTSNAGLQSSSDKTKLDGIETSATADQTAAEIRTLVESATDSNVFTDADHTKLNAIEASATADQTGAEIKTAYEAESDTNAYTDAEKTKLSGIAASANNYSISSDLLDEDNMASNSATKVPSQQSVKAYVDANSGGSGSTNLSATANGTSLTVESSSGNNVSLPAATTSAWGVMSDDDKTKLDGIEANATADQTGAQIKTAYEAESDTNAYTDAEKTKLSGIEANATADQTNAEIRAAVEAATDSNVFTDADHSKLNAIEASADVTDATNVNAAGAVMNSDLATKGQILVGDGSGDPSALSVGTNNYVLTADSSEATGIKWAAASGGVTSDVSNYNTSVGSGAGASFSGDDAKYNSLFGADAGNDITTGDYNSAFGFFSLTKVTTANNNTGFGASTLRQTVTGASNTAVGNSALENNTASDNTAVGHQALFVNTSGNGNAAVGYQALKANTTGADNTVLGYQAGDSITTGSNNLCLGYGADASAVDATNEITLGNTSVTKFRIPGLNFTLKDTTATDNYVLTVDANGECGWEAAAGGLSSDAQENLVAGSGAGSSLTASSVKNVLLGVNAGEDINTGDLNCAIGFEAFKQATTARFNTVIGAEAAIAVTSGIQNTCVGDSAGAAITTSSSNTYVGKDAGVSATGSNNVGVGLDAGKNLSGTNNTCIGYGAGDIGSFSGDNNTVIGYGADPSAADVDNEITLGDSSIATLRCQVTSITALSDRRDKTDINTLDLGLDFINSLKPVKFKWQTRDGKGPKGYEAGFIAQDFQQVQKDNDADYLGLVLESNPEKLEATPGKLIPILVKAIQELKMEVETLKNNG